MSRALALADLLLGAEYVPGARVLAGVGADPEPEHALGMPADPAPDARP